ncbi:MAG: hypothetical protein N4J56_007539 [Chroococcidiopsis sp. SAG 2025]|uniref:hypothetical protein n=1 Tax=Chroococcidiopsis sp. SAG 2025 TaxID=171389 RepID=UPI002936FE02|nr:hypothetical protein [Chroococcidiopsis sp. SAG 2025]MDV2997834.1 hypothetical protein [Chroococcidiopsis sp. SAG 2025]
MFEYCKTDGYNLATIYTTNQHLIALILLITIAYSCAVFSGRHSRHMGVQKYVGRLNELKRTCRRHSAFWIGLYGQLWVGAFLGMGRFSVYIDTSLASETVLFLQRSTGYGIDSACFLASLSPLQLNSFRFYE